MLAIENISHTYNGTDLALNDVSLRIGAGEFVCIAGANGSGKSTLARHMNALLVPSTGCVHACGLDTSDPLSANTIRSKIAMVFQNPDDALVASIVEDEVAFGPANLGITSHELRQRVTESLAATGLAGFEKREVNSLSGGQKQRLAIAGALAMKPAALILDEATAMLDPAGRKEVMSIATALHRSGTTVIMITHHLDQALLAERLVLMAHGRIVADGKPAQILANPEVVEKAGLLQPPAARLAHLLFQRGMDVPATANAKQLEEALCSLPLIK